MPAQRRQHQGQQAGADAGRDAHAHPALQSRGAPAHQFDQVVAGRQQLASLLHQGFAGRRQLGLAPAAHDQIGPQARLQFLDVQADGGRRQMQRLRRRGKSAQVGDGDQRLQLVEIEVTHQN